MFLRIDGDDIDDVDNDDDDGDNDDVADDTDGDADDEDTDENDEDADDDDNADAAADDDGDNDDAGVGGDKKQNQLHQNLTRRGGLKCHYRQYNSLYVGIFNNHTDFPSIGIDVKQSHV